MKICLRIFFLIACVAASIALHFAILGALAAYAYLVSHPNMVVNCAYSAIPMGIVAWLLFRKKFDNIL